MSGYPPDRSWVYDRNYPDRGGLKQSFINGVYNEFISKAQVQPDVVKEGGIRCPCDNCRCTHIGSAQEVVYHLCKHGFQPNYKYWTKHGEVNPSDATTGNSPFNQDSGNADTSMMNDDPITQMQDMVHDAFGLSYDSENMDDEGSEEIPAQPPNKDAQDFYDLLLTANRPLYEGASETRLSICVKLMACKTNWNVPEKCLDFFASMLIAVCPSKDTLPNNYYQAKRLVSMLGLKSQQIDCCPTGCLLYYKDNENDRECKFCNAHRKPVIYPMGNAWLPCRVASAALTSTIKAQFREPYSTWSEIPIKVVDHWFNVFGEYVVWDPKHEYHIKKIFKTKGTKRLSGLMMDARKSGERPEWIGEDAWKSLKEVWDKPEFKDKSMKAKQNRASAKGGSVHTGGSISTVEIAMRLAKKLGREPSVDEIFIATHQKKADKTWVDERARTTYEAYQEKIAEVSQGVGSNSQDFDPTIKLNVWAQSVGGKKRGRLYGTGDLACNYGPGVSCLTQESRAATGSYHFQSQYSPEMTSQMAATFEERARVAAQQAVQEALREANERAQLEQERAANFERQLKEMANSIALMQSQNRRAPRHEDYLDDESDDSD